MLLQVMTNARNISIHFVAIGKPDTSNLAECRIRFLGRGGLDLSTDPAFLRRALQSRSADFVALLYPRITDQLVYRRHFNSRLSYILTRRRGQLSPAT